VRLSRSGRTRGPRDALSDEARAQTILVFVIFVTLVIFVPRPSVRSVALGSTRWCVSVALGGASQSLWAGWK